MSTDYAHMPGREILRRVEEALRYVPVGKIGGIPREHVARALRDLERSMRDSDDETWEPFRQSFMADQSNDDAYVAALVKSTGVDAEEVRKGLRDLVLDQYWRNNLYQVSIRRMPPPDGDGPDLLHLSIKRTDQRVIHDWRHLQRIKNELAGPEHEGVELYPAESRVVDSANQYHLWVVDDPAFRWPFGWKERLIVAEQWRDGSGAVQRAITVPL
jgi:hypothetical protein